MNSFKNRIIRAAKLDVHLYEEVEADRGATMQALGVVVLSSIAVGIGSITRVGIAGVLVGTVMALIGWFVWSYLIYLIGTKLLPEPQTKADYGELLRTIGFANSPGLIRIFGIIPGLSVAAFYGALFWILIATVFAVRQALDYKSTIRAVAVCVIGWIIQILLMRLIFSFLGSPSNLPEGF
ncbi:MAG: YIP1 family protein [Candidatus Mariimomonas ferrooxydans]